MGSQARCQQKALRLHTETPQVPDFRKGHVLPKQREPEKIRQNWKSLLKETAVVPKEEVPFLSPETMATLPSW